MLKGPTEIDFFMFRFLRTKEGRCTDFRDTAEKVQTGFKMYLNVAPTVTSWSSANDEFSLVFEVISYSENFWVNLLVIGQPSGRVCRTAW